MSHTVAAKRGRQAISRSLLPRPIAEQESRAGAGAAGLVAGIVELAAVERQAAAADAAVEQVARPFEHRDALLQGAANAVADRLPVLPRRRTAAAAGSRARRRSRRARGRASGRSGRRTAAACRRAAKRRWLPRCGSPSPALRLVEANGRDRHSGPPGKLADRQQRGLGHGTCLAGLTSSELEVLACDAQVAQSVPFSRGAHHGRTADRTCQSHRQRPRSRRPASWTALFGWRVRWQGPARNGGRTIHVGSADHYIALYSGLGVAYTADDFAKGQPLNHIGVEVDDLAPSRPGPRRGPAAVRPRRPTNRAAASISSIPTASSTRW